MAPLRRYRQVWVVDFEFTAPPGEPPFPLCVVARELHSDALVRHWLGDNDSPLPPYATGKENLFVAFFASAELGCHLSLAWPLPERVLDLYAEFRCLTSGLTVTCGHGLLGALAYYGLDGMAAAEKEEMRQLAIRGGHYTEAEKAALLDYCQSDVDALAKLLPKMLPSIDLPRALLRGRYMAAVARMERHGIPLDMDTLDSLRPNWEGIKYRLISEVDKDYRVFVPTGRRAVDPATRLGAAIIAEAKEWDILPERLAEAVDYVWRAEREATADTITARRHARKATGLTHARINRWEDAGRDYGSVSGLDADARELAGGLPDLGIGTGYVAEAGYDDTDYASRLWDVLRNRDEAAKPKHHPDILRRAAEMVAACPAPGTWEGPLSFSAARWGEYLQRKGVPWPRLPSGALALDEGTFREMARAYPAEVGPIRELRHALSELRLNALTVGTDGRNRCLLSPFGSKTGRNQPSNAKYIFGPSCWLRSLIKPAPGWAVAYIDWSQQELAIAARLSGDAAMQEAYISGDFYLTFAKLAGAVPADGTKQTHGAIRDQFKTVALGVLYGLSAEGLARKLDVPPCRGRELLHLHQQTFRTFWAWSDRVEMQAELSGRLQTVFGWRVHVGPDANPRSLRNFPMQAHGAEMLRLACCLATEHGIRVCAPVHDALLIEAPLAEIDRDVLTTQALMAEASALVLPGFPLRTEAKIVRHPERYLDPRGERMWQTVTGQLAGCDRQRHPWQNC